MVIEQGRGKRPYKIWDSGRQIRKGLVVANFKELIERGREKLELGNVRVRVVLESDGTQVEDPDYFSTLPENTVFLLLRQGEHWYPAGVEVLRQAITAIPKIVCETIYNLGLHDEAPVWKVMDQYGKITVVLAWDPCNHRGGGSVHYHSHAAPSSSSPRKPTTQARVIVSGVGESAIQRNDSFLTAQSSFGSSSSPQPTNKSPIPMVAGTVTSASLSTGPTPTIHGTVTTIHRDGKKETLINDVDTSNIVTTHHQGTVINHDSEFKSSYIGSGGVVGRLSRQGSSVESGHSTVHIHTQECSSYGHPSHPHKATNRASPTGEKGTCDFHCCDIHDEGATTTTTARVQPPSRQHSQEHRHQQQSTSQSQTQQLTVQVHNPPSSQTSIEDRRSGHHSSHSPAGKSSISAAAAAAGAQVAKAAAAAAAHAAAQKSGGHVRFLPDYRCLPSAEKSQHKDGDSSESETENTTNDDEAHTCQKFLLLIDQPSVDVKKHLSIKDIGIILDRLSSRIVDVERLDREADDDCFNWTIKATIRGESLRELGVLYGGHFYTISEHPAYGITREEQDAQDEEEEDEEDENDSVKAKDADVEPE